MKQKRYSGCRLEVYFSKKDSEKTDRNSCVHIICCMNKLC